MSFVLKRLLFCCHLTDSSSHANSVDKFSTGDYLLSGRHVNTLYRISRADRSILWRLGGSKSDFVADFNFSMQHDARIVSENSTTIVLTLLDNAVNNFEEQTPTSSTSSAKMIALYTAEEPMRAKVRHDYFLFHSRWATLTIP